MTSLVSGLTFKPMYINHMLNNTSAGRDSVMNTRQIQVFHLHVAATLEKTCKYDLVPLQVVLKYHSP